MYHSIILRTDPNYVFILDINPRLPTFTIYPTHAGGHHMTISTSGSVNMDCIDKKLGKQLALPLLTHLETCFSKQNVTRSQYPTLSMLSNITSVTIALTPSCRNKMLTHTQKSKNTIPYMQSDEYKLMPSIDDRQAFRSIQQPFLDNLELFKGLHALHQKHTNTPSSGLMQGLREATTSEFPIQGILIDKDGNFYAPLWHGTNANQTGIRSILSGGLDIRFAKIGTNHGRGIYASPDIKKAMTYTGAYSVCNIVFLLVCLGKKPYISSDYGAPLLLPWTSKLFYPKYSGEYWEVITYNNDQHLPLLHLQSQNHYDNKPKGITSIVQACEVKPSLIERFSMWENTTTGLDETTPVQCPVM